MATKRKTARKKASPAGGIFKVASRNPAYKKAKAAAKKAAKKASAAYKAAIRKAKGLKTTKRKK